MALDGQTNAPIFIAKIDFNFNFTQREEASQALTEAKEELRQLERLRKKKQVGTLISTIQAALSVAQSTLVYKHLRRLGFVLATPGDQEEEACRLLEEIVSVATEVMRQQKVDNSQYIEVMRVATYIKSICTRLGE